MPMPVPEERVYYYELRECGNVLLCWMPRVELERLVADKGVDARILADHPHGVDVEINEPDLAYHKRRYGIDIGISAKDLLLAFEAITESKEVDAPGEIKGSVVESLAKEDVPSDEPMWNEREPIAIEQAQAVLRENPVVQMRVDQGLRVLREQAESIEPPGPEGAGDPKEQLRIVMQRVRRTKGEAPRAVFTRLQRRAKGR
jgi:hypothetical protein